MIVWGVIRVDDQKLMGLFDSEELAKSDIRSYYCPELYECESYIVVRSARKRK